MRERRQVREQRAKYVERVSWRIDEDCRACAGQAEGGRDQELGWTYRACE